MSDCRCGIAERESRIVSGMSFHVEATEEELDDVDESEADYESDS